MSIIIDIATIFCYRNIENVTVLLSSLHNIEYNYFRNTFSKHDVPAPVK